jgi:serine/threonine protein kinase
MALDTSKPALQTVGNYELLEKIAEGGMGTVYKGRHRETGQIVAIKIVPPHLTGNTVMLKRFEKEFRAASQLNHPNVVRALDYGTNGSTPFLVMEFVDGESLGQKIERDGRLNEAEALRIIVQVAQGLHRAHKQGMIHRDVKPDNVLVTPDGQAKLADLGLVKEVEADLNLTRTGRGLGTPHFMAPEQFRNAKNADVRCDIYSLGATLYMMVTGELPFKSCGPLDAWMKKINNELMAPRDLVPDLSERLDWAIRRAMSADPEQRPTTCREFVEDLTGRSTRKLTPPEGSEVNPDVWYLVYDDEEGATHKVKGTTSGIRRSLKEQLLGEATHVRASRVKEGSFELLRSFPEFRDLVITPAPLNPVRATGATPTTPVRTPPRSKTDSPVVTPDATEPWSPPIEDSDAIPHIQFETARQSAGNPEWLKWLALLLIAVVTAVVAFFLLPKSK